MTIRIAALLLTGLTGFTGLVYEVTWQKYLGTLLGSQSEATAAVLAIFLGGLSLGYALFGRLTLRLTGAHPTAVTSSRVLLAYGAVELAIGIYAFLFHRLFLVAQALSIQVPADNTLLAFSFDVALATLLIGPASVMMGATIPMLTQALSRQLEDATRFHALVYGTNTAGAFAGALAAGFWLVPSLGLVRVLQLMGGLNLLAGVALAGLGMAISRGAPKRDENGTSDPVSAPEVSGIAWYCAVALLTGFAMMTIQTVLIRLGGLALGSSQFTFSMVVAAFVACIALGSFAVSLLPRIPPTLLVANQWALTGLLALLYTQLEDAPYWAHQLRIRFGDSPAEMLPYYGAAFGALVAIAGLPILLSGAVLPLLFHHLRRQVGGLGAVAGRLYGWNTTGSLVGALVGGYLLFFWLDLHHIFRLAVGVLAVTSGLLAVRVAGASVAATGVLIAVCLTGLATLPAWSPERLSSGLFRLREPLSGGYSGPDALFERRRRAMKQDILFYTDDPTTSVAVARHLVEGGRRSLAIIANGKADGSLIPDYPTMALLSILPALLAHHPERAFIIGYGTGVSVGEFAALNSSREVVVAEISSGVIDAAPLFESGNQHAAASVKTRIVRTDAYRALLRSDDRYDAIISEPSNPWVTGVEMLYSREFLAVARSRLEPGGVYVQWLHIYETDEASVSLILRTFASVFPSRAIWYSNSADILIVGFRDPPGADQLDRLLARASQPDYQAALQRAGIASIPALLAHELIPLGAAEALPGPIHTLLHPILSDWAARAFFPGHIATLPRTLSLETSRAGARNSLVRQYTRRRGQPLSDAERAEFVTETCDSLVRECIALLARWYRDDPDSPVLSEILALSMRRSELRQELSQQRLLELGALFDATQAADWPDAGEPPAQQAARAAELFVDYYHHAEPFGRQALAATLDRCAADDVSEFDRSECRRLRDTLESRIGELVPAPKR